ncbi:MAG: hypothetical protein IAE97_09920 [Chthoniobacterales bacterium]|nr:hypothetical protein [Chthoniobacterales bacterium]
MTLFPQHRALRRLLAVMLAGSALASQTHAAQDFLQTDTVVLKDGTEIRGLILRNSASNVLIETGREELEISKDNIRRIIDEPGDDAATSAVTPAGRLPHWHSIVQDFRNHDATRTFRPVPATAIDNGFLRSIPYLSYRVNENAEMNIYGDPEDPVALELGVYGRGAFNRRHRLTVREFLAGHLGSRREIAALYALDLDGGEIRAGRLAIRCTPPGAPDAYGGWWLCIYDPARLEKARVGDKAYAKVTRPFHEVNDRNGSLRAQSDDTMLDSALNSMSGTMPWLRGFSRDKAGVLHVAGAPES